MSHLGERLSALIDGELTHTQRERVLAHLVRCDPCRREAVAMRTLKRRMHALGEATAAATLTDRLLALAARAGPARGGGWPSAGRRYLASPTRRQWVVRSLAVAALLLVGLAIPAAAFLVGGNQQEPGPSVTPAVDVFIVQHAITTGEVPAQDPSTQSPSAQDPGAESPGAQDPGAESPGARGRGAQESAAGPEATASGPAVTAGTGAPGLTGVPWATGGHPNAGTWHARHRLSAAARLPASASRTGLETR